MLIMRRWVPLMLWLATCAAAMVALWSVEEPRFDPPPSDPAAWSQWASGRDVLDAAAGISRLLATVALGYLFLVSVVHLLALAWGPAGLHRFTARLSPTPVAALAATAVLGGSPLAAAMGHSVALPNGGDDPGAVPAPVMRVIEDEAPRRTTSTTPTTTVPTTTVPTTTVPTTTVPPGSVTEPGSEASSSSRSAPAPEVTPRTAPTDGATTGYLVAVGDNLWSIARGRVRLDLGREPTEAEVRGYWVALMALNAPRMVEPGNPNLLLPGQELQLPG